MAQPPVNSPCHLPLPTPLDNSLCNQVPLTYLESLLPVWCDPRPPWSQVACKLTSPSPFPFPAPNRSPNFQLCTLLRRHHDTSFTWSGTILVITTLPTSTHKESYCLYRPITLGCYQYPQTVINIHRPLVPSIC
jgi:hypothetical protein